MKKVLWLGFVVFVIVGWFGNSVNGTKKPTSKPETLAGLKIGDPIQKAISIWGKYKYQIKNKKYVWRVGKKRGPVELKVLAKNKIIKKVVVWALDADLTLSPSLLRKLGTGTGFALGDDDDHEKIIKRYKKEKKNTFFYETEEDSDSFGAGFQVGEDIIFFGFFLGYDPPIRSITLGDRDVMDSLLKQAIRKKSDKFLQSGISSSCAVYKNGRFGFEITYPNNWVAEYSENGDGIGCVSKDSRSKMRAYASFFPDKEIKGVSSKNTVKVRRESEKESYRVSGVLYYYSNNGKTGLILLTHEKNIYYTVILEAPSSVYNQLHKSIFAKIIQDYKIIDGVENS